MGRAVPYLGRGSLPHEKNKMGIFYFFLKYIWKYWKLVVTAV